MEAAWVNVRSPINSPTNAKDSSRGLPRRQIKQKRFCYSRVRESEAGGGGKERDGRERGRRETGRDIRYLPRLPDARLLLIARGGPEVLHQSEIAPCGNAGHVRKRPSRRGPRKKRIPQKKRALRCDVRTKRGGEERHSAVVISSSRMARTIPSVFTN